MSNQRRQFLKASAGIGAALAIDGPLAAGQSSDPPPTNPDPNNRAAPKPLDVVRIGFVGAGVKGIEHIENLLRIEGVEIRAVCDVRPEACIQTQQLAIAKGDKPPTAYDRGDHDFQRMCAEEDLDLVYTATPWEWHVPVCLAAMKNGKHAATEIPAAITVDTCWSLVETAESTGKYCAMMENVNYMREEMMIFHMVRKGLFGEIIHTEGAYEHDTRFLKIKDVGDGLWLGEHHARRNGNLYPCHGLGPLAWYLDINRGDRLDYMVSMSSKARGMDLYAQEHLPVGHAKRVKKYINGDVNSSLIRTVQGATIILKHDTDLPRPYGRAHLIQGTRGLIRRFPEFKYCLEEADPHPWWQDAAALFKEHEHPLWRSVLAELAEQLGPDQAKPELITGDYMEDRRLIEALRSGVAPDFDVYDAATWSVVGPLSEQSVANRSQPVDIPDFTRGRWKTTPPLTILGV
jgi:hypothetical protein